MMMDTIKPAVDAALISRAAGLSTTAEYLQVLIELATESLRTMRATAGAVQAAVGDWHHAEVLLNLASDQVGIVAAVAAEFEQAELGR